MADDQLIERLASLTLFEGLDRAALAAIANKGTLTRYKSGDQVIFQGVDEGSAHVILKGVVRVTVFAETGREVLFRDMGAGEPLGVVASLDEMPRTTYAIAKEDVELLTFDRGSFLAILSAHPEISLRMLAHTSGLVRELTERLISVLTTKASYRIRQWLMDTARNNPRDEHIGVIESPLTHAELASMIGSHREVVSRELSELGKKGIIRKDRGKSLEVDLDLLSRETDDM